MEPGAGEAGDEDGRDAPLTSHAYTVTVCPNLSLLLLSQPPEPPNIKRMFQPFNRNQQQQLQNQQSTQFIIVLTHLNTKSEVCLSVLEMISGHINLLKGKSSLNYV